MKTFTLIYFIFLMKLGQENGTGNCELKAKSSRKVKKCTISIPKETEAESCKEEREKSISKNRDFYKLTIQGEQKTIKFPLENIPWLNQTMKAVEHHTVLDPVDGKWLTLFGAFKKGLEKRANEMKKSKRLPSFTTIQDYKNLFLFHNHQMKTLKVPDHFSNPTMEAAFTNILEGDTWCSDDLFVQKRLAGPCPFLLKRVTIEGAVGMKWEKLKNLLNSKFDYISAIEHAYGEKIRTFGKAIKKNILYVLYNPEENDMETQHDATPKGKQIENITSPIALFVKSISGELKIAAIQWDYKPNSTVYTPSDSIEWWKAKAMVNIVDADQCQGHWHLGNVHFATNIYCTIFRSHFSELHPLHQIMRYHCEGTTPHITTAWPALSIPNQQGRLFSMGYQGFVKLASCGYSKSYYGKLAYDKLLKTNGLDLKSGRIEYYPFRDDGKVLWKEFKNFARDFVNMFYQTSNDVKKDTELQSFANEVSIDGKVPPFGGRGKVPRFPSKFNTKRQLKTFITRFMWIIAMHSAVNYPVEPWQTFVPASPLKLYRSNGSKIDELRDPKNTMGIIAFGSVLGNFRANRIMDYYEKVQGNQLRELVEKYHDRFHSRIQKQLEERNAERKSKKKMGFQYFEPKWLPNSIHI